MKSTNGILLYFFIVYATSVVVNFTHYHSTLTKDDTNQLTIINAANCLIHGKNDVSNGQDNCKLSFQYNKESVLNLLKNLLGRKEFNKFYKLTLKNGSKKGASDLINITLDLKPLFNVNNLSNTDQVKLINWYSFYIFISIILIAFITPLLPMTNYIYIITLTSMILFSITVYLQILKLIVFSLIYMMTFRKYKFWLLPNLNKDVGLFGSFWPIYELRTVNDHSIETTNDFKNVTNQSLNDKIETCLDANSNKQNKQPNRFNGKLVKINLNSIKKPDQTGEKDTKDISTLNESDQSIETELNLTKNKSTSLSDDKSHKTITQFIGNDRLPTITTTPPPDSKFIFKPTNRLEIVDLNNEPEENKDKKINIIIKDEKQLDANLDDYASITPVVSYLNVNEIRRRQNLPARERIESNRSDDGFEILNNDFIRTSPSISSSRKDDSFVSTKRNL